MPEHRPRQTREREHDAEKRSTTKAMKKLPRSQIRTVLRPPKDSSSAPKAGARMPIAGPVPREAICFAA